MNGVKFRYRSPDYKKAYFRRVAEAGGRQDGEITNREYANTAEFQAKCDEAKIKPTKRQASRYRNGYGSLAK